MAYLRSIDNFTINFTGTTLGDVNIDQLVADGTMIEHGYIAEGGNVQSGLNGGSTINANPNKTYEVNLYLPVDNDNIRDLQDIFDYGKNSTTVGIGAFFLRDGGNKRNVASASAFIQNVSTDTVSTDAGTARQVTFHLADATTIRG